jgi:hypothetical protein
MFIHKEDSTIVTIAKYMACIAGLSTFVVLHSSLNNYLYGKKCIEAGGVYYKYHGTQNVCLKPDSIKEINIR